MSLGTHLLALLPCDYVCANFQTIDCCKSRVHYIRCQPVSRRCRNRHREAGSRKNICICEENLLLPITCSDQNQCKSEMPPSSTQSRFWVWPLGVTQTLGGRLQPQLASQELWILFGDCEILIFLRTINHRGSLLRTKEGFLVTSSVGSVLSLPIVLWFSRNFPWRRFGFEQ